MSIGYHVSRHVSLDTKSTKKAPLHVALEEAYTQMIQLGFKSLSAQIFVTGPQSYKELLSAEDTTNVRRVISDRNINTVIHGAYVDNPWNLSQGSIHNIKKELAIAASIGATGVVVHLGANANKTLSEVLTKIANDMPPEILEVVTLWLEINAAKPTVNTFETPKKLNALFDEVAKCKPPALKVGLCIDTAHLWSCGIALTTYEAAQKWLSLLPQVPIMLHLNDSKSILSSGVDRHDRLTDGNIWGLYKHHSLEDSGLTAILNWAESNNIMTILERDHAGTFQDLKLIAELGYFSD